jgi:hypothetical protein
MLHTWILICLAGTSLNECNLSTATRWFQIADQPSSHTRAIRAAQSVVMHFLDRGSYQKLTQSPVGVSLGTDTYILFSL